MPTASPEIIPASTTYLVIGAGVNGLSTAWHLAMELERRGKKRSGADILVIDKTGPGGGASGIACGLSRGFYMTAAMHPLIRESFDVWTYDRVGFGFQQVGYVSCGEANQLPDYERVHKSQNEHGYLSDLYTAGEARQFLRSLWPDLDTRGIDVVLHEKMSGYSGTRQAMQGFAEKCAEHGVRVLSGVTVTGYDVHNGSVKRVLTDHGPIKADVVVLALGPWMGLHWQMLGLPMTLDLRFADGTVRPGVDMWTYWRLVEGEVYLDGPYLTPEGRDPPIFKMELMNTPVEDPKTGKRLGDFTYAYWKYAAERTRRPGLQGGSVPVKLGPKAALEPYGHANKDYQSGPEFRDYFAACMASRMKRLANARANYVDRPSGGIGAFTPDNLPVYDWMLPNLYMIADSNHGYKFTGVGKLVARHLATGEKVAALEPFRFSRYAEGRTFGKTNTNSPWV
jgi:glycine/D-amino acid oxidase-like deaminating enzyme